MTSIDLKAEQQSISETLDKLSLPEDIRVGALAVVGEQLAEALGAADAEAIEKGIEQAWLTVCNHYRGLVANTMEAWVDGDLIDPEAAKRMIERIPDGPGAEFAGLDAGVSAALGIVPVDKQDLIRSLHADYTPQAVERVKREIASGLNADHETTWWLSMSSLCQERQVDPKIQVDAKTFVQQLAAAMELRDDPEKRITAANEESEAMKLRVETIKDGIGSGTEDGCIQGAYLCGCDVGVNAAGGPGVPIFVGTFRGAEVDLKSFKWGTESDEEGKSLSGQIATGFYKVADQAELTRLVDQLKTQLDL